MRHFHHLLFFLLLTACGSSTPDPGEKHPLEGQILEVSEGSLVVDHKEIPGVMRAMAMRLATKDGDNSKFKRGDLIRAELVVIPGKSHLRKIEVTGHEELPDLNGEPHPLVAGDILPSIELHVSEEEVWKLGPGQDGVIILTFLFTTCPFPDYCPLLATKLAQLQDEIRGKAKIVAVTLDPETDNFEVLKTYGESYGADSSVWRFAREPLEKLEGLFDNLAMLRYKKDGYIIHDLKLAILDEKGTILHIENDNGWDNKRILKEVEKAQPTTP